MKQDTKKELQSVITQAINDYFQESGINTILIRLNQFLTNNDIVRQVIVTGKQIGRAHV